MVKIEDFLEDNTRIDANWGQITRYEIPICCVRYLRAQLYETKKAINFVIKSRETLYQYGNHYADIPAYTKPAY